MELKPGYKQTEVGVIPVDWDVVQLGDLKPFVTSGSRGWASFYSEYGDLFVRITNMSRGSIYLDLADSKYVRVPRESSEGVRTQLQEHDVLISITADIGIVSYVDAQAPFPAYINQHIALVRFDPELANGKFVSYFLAADGAQRNFRAKTDNGAKAGMSLGGVAKIQAALPPHPEQSAIATALSDVDALLSGLDKLIAKKRDLKQAAMQQLLTGKTRLPGFVVKAGFKQTEVGVIPEDWEISVFRDIVRSYVDYRGRTPGKLGMDWGGGEILALSANNVQMGRIASEKEAYFGSENLYRKWMRQGECERGDILLTMEAPLGNVARIPDDQKYILSQRVLLIKPNASIRGDYLYHLMRGGHFQYQLEKHSTGSTAKGIQRAKLDELSIWFPKSEAEQFAIAEVLSDMDVELATLEARREKSKLFKQGMTQELLTGKTRLV